MGTETVVEGRVTFRDGHVPAGNFSKDGYEFAYPTLSKTAYEANTRDTSGTKLEASALARRAEGPDAERLYDGQRAG